MTWPPAGLSRAHFSREFRAFGESPHAYLLTRGSSGRRRCCAHRPLVADICLSVGLQSIGSFTTSFTALRLSPTAYGRPPPAAAPGPGCWSAPTPAQHRTFREDSTPVRA